MQLIANPFDKRIVHIFDITFTISDECVLHTPSITVQIYVQDGFRLNKTRPFSSDMSIITANLKTIALVVHDGKEETANLQTTRCWGTAGSGWIPS